MSTLYNYADNLSTTLASGYTAASGTLALTSSAGWPTGGSHVTVITLASYQTSSEVLCLYTYSGVSGNNLTGVTAVSGFTDQNFSAGAIVQQRVPAEALNNLNTNVNANTSAISAIDTALNSVPDGVLKGASGVLHAATPGTDYLVSNQAITLSGAVTGSGTTAITTTLTTVTVSEGGTGDTSLTAYAVLCGGTTSTGAVQSVASLGTSGQVLTSNGAAALPTFQAIPSVSIPAPSSAATYTTPLSPVQVTTSSFGCPPMVSTSNLSLNTDATAYVQAILNLVAPGGLYFGRPLEVIIDQQLMVGQLAVYSGTTIRGANGGSFVNSTLGFAFTGSPWCGLWSRPMSGNGDAGVLVNANPQSNYIGSAATIYTPTNITDHDITIRDLYIDGCRRYGVANGSDVRINASGNMVRPVIMFGVANLVIDNVFVYDPITFGINLANIYHANVSRIVVIDPVQFATPTPAFGRNTAGIQCEGPWDQLTIRDVVVCCNDDAVAFNMADGNLSQTIGTLSGPQIFSVPGKSGSVNAEFQVCYYGSAGRTVLKNLRLLNNTAGVRILGGSDPRNSGVNPAIMTYIDIDGVYGNCGNGPLIADSGASFGTGAAGTYIVNTLLMRNVSVLSTPSQGTSLGFQVPASQTATFKGFHFSDLTVANAALQQIKVNGNCGTITIDDYAIFEDSSESATPASAVVVGGGFNVSDLNIVNMRWTRNATTATSMVTVSTTGTVNNISLTDVYANNLNNILNVTGSATVTNLNTAGLCHLGANGNPSLNLGSSNNVARVRCASSNTVQLASATGFTSKKTDGTEDS